MRGTGELMLCLVDFGEVALSEEVGKLEDVVLNFFVDGSVFGRVVLVLDHGGSFILDYYYVLSSIYHNSIIGPAFKFIKKSRAYLIIIIIILSYT